MKDLGNYVCDGQMDIFDFLQQDEPEVTESVSPEEEYKDIVNDYWHEVPGSMPTNSNWMPALFVLYNSKTKETHYNVPGEVKDNTFRRPKDSPEGEVIAWRYKL